MSEKSEGDQEMILVPLRPTKEMVDAAWASAYDGDAAGVWEAMIEEWLRLEKGKVG